MRPDTSRPPQRKQARRSGPVAERMRNPLEGDVLVRRGAAAAADGRGGALACVDRDVGAGREAVAIAAALAAAAKELDGVGDDVDRRGVLAGPLALPLAPLEAAVDRDTAA